MSSLGHAVNDVSWFLLPLIIPLIRTDLRLTYTRSGLLVTIYLAVGACSAYLSGRASDRWGLKRVIAGGFVVGAVGFCFVSLSRTYGELALSLVVAGAGTATFHPCAYTSLNQAYPRRRGTAFGKFESSGSMGVLITLMTRGALFPHAPWRPVAAGTAGVLAAMGALTAALWPRGKREAGDATDPGVEQRRDSADTSGRGALRAGPGRNGRARPGLAPNNVARPLAILLAALGLRAFGATSLVNFLPTFLADVRGFGASQVSFGSACMYVGGMTGAFLIGTRADRGGARALLRTVFAALVPAAALVGWSGARWLMLASLAAYGGLSSGTFPTQGVVVSQIGDDSSQGVGELFGTLMSVFTFVAAVGPWVAGAVADAVGLSLTFRLTAIPMALGAVVLHFLPDPTAHRRLELGASPD